MQYETPLIRELDELFRQDPDIDELGIIFTIPPPNSSMDGAKSGTDEAREAAIAEPQFILREHKLGVSVHSVHPLINEARAAFPAARGEYRWEWSAWEGKGRRMDLAVGAAAAAERLLSVTRALLLVNADHGSAWNARKELAREGVFGDIRQEIKLLNLIFTKHAKSPNAWAHRRWCWRNDEHFGRRQQRAGTWRPLAVEEELLVGMDRAVGSALLVCQRVADLYPKNYYAWTQRSWVVLRVVGETTGIPEGSEDRAKKMSLVKDLLQRELDFVDGWLTSHVSDHSALNHRKNIVSALAAVSPALDFVEKERTSNSALIRDYPGHESLWCYRRFLCQIFLVATPPQSLHKPRRLRAEQKGSLRELGTRDCCCEVGADLEDLCPEIDLLEDRYDWSGWRYAAAEWYEGCRRAEAAAQEESSSEEHSDVEETDRSDGPDAWSDDRPDYESAEGELPGAPADGSMLAEFLGREIRFAFKCATDEGAWQFKQQRRHALVHLAFATYAANRILRRREKVIHEDSVSERRGHEGIDAGCTAYCEITGAPKLAFPLCFTSEKNVEDRSGFDCRRDRVGCLRALKEFNEFVRDLARAKALENVEQGCSRGVAVLYGV